MNLRSYLKNLNLSTIRIMNLNANHENPETVNLDHKFKVVALSETWITENKQERHKIGTLDSYQS